MSKTEEYLARIEKSLLGIKEVLTFEEACLYTGISRTYMYKLTSTSRIPHSKPNGKFLFFDRKQLDEWLRKNPRKTQAQTEEEALSYIIRKHRAATLRFLIFNSKTCIVCYCKYTKSFVYGTKDTLHQGWHILLQNCAGSDHKRRF